MQQSVRIFIATALPRRMWIGEINLHPRSCRNFGMASHFAALIMCNGFSSDVAIRDISLTMASAAASAVGASSLARITYRLVRSTIVATAERLLAPMIRSLPMPWYQTICNFGRA